MKKHILSLLLLVIACSSYAQEQASWEQLADQRYERFEFVTAAPIYEKVLQSKKVKPKVHYKLGYCYDMMQQYPQAIGAYTSYMEAKNDSTDAFVWMRIGDMEKILQRYDAARISYGRYSNATNHTQDNLVAKKIAGCDSAVIWMQDSSSRVKLMNEKLLNTDVSDWGVSFYGNRLVFTSDHMVGTVSSKEKAIDNKKIYGRNGHAFLKMYATDTVKYDTVHPVTATMAADTGKVQILEFKPGGDEYTYHVGPSVFSKNMDTVYFTVTNDGNDLLYKKAITRNVATRKLELYYSVKGAQGEWKAPVAFAYNNVKYYSIGHAALSADGSVLYFTSDMPGGQGSTDIWYCHKTSDGKWDKPVNCGSVINTPAEEAFPTVVQDTLLYFSSTGHPGMGGLDIFSTRGVDSFWRAPVNLKRPFNSSHDDFYCNIKGRVGYLSSDRDNGMGSDDIYSFILPPRPVYRLLLDNTVLSSKDSTIIKGAKVQLTCGNLRYDTTCISDATGRNTFLVKKDQEYKLEAAYTGYITDHIAIVTSGYKDIDTVYSKIYLSPVPVLEKIPIQEYKVGDKFVLENLYYDLDKYNIRPDAAIELDKLVDILVKHPRLEIELSSHTDSRGSDQHNLILSKNRAKSAVKYLISKGIESFRVIAAGYGETKLTNKCSNGVKCTEAQHQMNRRTEVKILKN